MRFHIFYLFPVFALSLLFFNEKQSTKSVHLTYGQNGVKNSSVETPNIINQRFPIELPNRTQSTISFTALADQNLKSVAVELMISQENDGSDEERVLSFNIGTDNDLEVFMRGKGPIGSKGTRLPNTTGSWAFQLDIVLQIHCYQLKLNGTRLGKLFCPKEWWKEYRWWGINVIRVEGEMKLLQKPTAKQISDSSTVRPIILAWNRFWGDSIYDSDSFVAGSKECADQCVYTEDKTLEESASIVIFHTALSFGELPHHRQPKQLYVMLSHESPLSGSADVEKLDNNFYNISITYRRDSTIFVPYDALAPITPQTSPTHIWSDQEIRKRLSLKKRLAVQFVSNCYSVQSGRAVLTEQLQKLVELDVYGDCNKRPCDANCYQREQKSHFFYMAFENAVCKDYVTEKFWKSLRNLVVPVVLSRKVMEEAGIPDDTYIAADDFGTVQALADHLQTVQRDMDKYLGYLNWTKKYQRERSDDIKSAFCQLCEIAHKQKREEEEFKTYTVQLDKFWPKDQCKANYVQETIMKNGGTSSSSGSFMMPKMKSNGHTDLVHSSESMAF